MMDDSWALDFFFYILEDSVLWFVFLVCGFLLLWFVKEVVEVDMKQDCG